MLFFFEGLENKVGKGENAGNQHAFSPFPTMSLTLFSIDTYFNASTTDSF